MKHTVKLEDGKTYDVTILDGKFQKIQESSEQSNLYMIPGFIETHSHGGYGFDFIHDDPEKAKFFLNQIAVNEGTTSIVGTTITTDKSKVINAINSHKHLVNYKNNGAQLLGYHIEGPFINPLKKGAHPVDKMIIPKFENIKKFLNNDFTNVKIITLAPELSDLETLKKLKSYNIKIFAGHTMSDYNSKFEYIDCITHFNNAMIKYGQDNDSLAKNTIKSSSEYIEFINDGVHNTTELADIIKSTKPEDKLILITDSLDVKGLPDGTYKGPNWDITKKDGAAWTPEGVLNGSVYTQIEAFKDWIINQKSTLSEAIKATSTNAANLLGLKKGKIKQGYDADFIIMDDNFNIIKVYREGLEINDNIKQ